MDTGDAKDWIRRLRVRGRLFADVFSDFGKLVYYASGRFYRDHCFAKAATLSYALLLAFIPLIAIGFSILSAFPVFDEVRAQLFAFLFENFLPRNVEETRERFNAFLQNTGQLTALGTVGLAVAALILLDEIDTIFNQIWRQAKPRPILARLTMYWAILTLTPLLIGGSVGISSYLVARADISGSAIDPGLRVLPFLLVAAALVFAYIVVPYRRVRFRDALIGALVAALLFEGLKRGFALYFSYYAVYETLYGALSVVPLFLVWLFLGWCAVLVGAELTAALPEWRAGLLRHGDERLPMARRLALGLGVLWVLQDAAARGDTVEGLRIARRLRVEPDYTEPLLERLAARGLIRELDEENWVLLRDLDDVTLGDVVDALGLGLDGDEIGRLRVPWRGRLAQFLETAAKAQQESLNVSVRSLLRGSASGPAKGKPRSAAND